MPNKLLATCATLLLLASQALGEADYVDATALRDADLAKYWQLRVPLAPNQQIASAYLVNDQVYLATGDGVVFAIHAPSGALRWRKEITTADYDIRKPCHAGSRVAFVMPPTIAQYDRYTGRPISRIETGFPTGSPAISDGARLFVGGIDYKMYAFPLDLDFEQWKARASGPIVSQPQILGKYLYYASDNGNIYACVAGNKKFYWRTYVHGSVTADLAVDENGVYVAGRDQVLRLLDQAKGGRRWRARFSGPLYEPPVLTKETAFQYCAQDGVAAVNTGTVGVEQRVRWTIPTARKLLTIDGELAYLFSVEESILVADLDDGDIKFTIPTPGFTLPLPSPGLPALYFASTDGRVFCAKKLGAPPLLAADVRKAVERPAADTTPESDAGAEAAEDAAADDDPLATKRSGPPLGGKSKVSKEYTGE